MKGVVENSFSLNLTLMKLLSCYPLAKYQRFYKYYSLTIYAIIIAPVAVLGFIQLFLGDHPNAKFDEVTISIVFSSPKLLSIVINGKNIQKCIVYFDKDIFESQSQHHMDIVDDCVKISRRNSTVFFFGCLGAMCSWYGKLYFGDRRHLPLDVWLPFTDMPILYNCLYFDLIIGVFYGGLISAAIDPLITGLICHASGQVQVVKENLKRLDISFVQASNNTVTKSKLMYKELSKCIEHYDEIAKLVDELIESFSTAILCQFMHSVSTICIFCLQISKLPTFDINFLIISNYLVVILVQVYFYCYYGTILIEENYTLIKAIYMSNWYEYDQQTKKALIVLMERSKRPLVVTVGKIFDLSLDTFTLILKRSYSLLAVLKNY